MPNSRPTTAPHPASDLRRLFDPEPVVEAGCMPDGMRRDGQPREPTLAQQNLIRERREIAILIAEIRWTAAALDLARTVVARRAGQWGFAGGNPRRHEVLAALAKRSLCRTIPELARELRCSRQAAHRLTTALARQGLVSVEPLRHDTHALYVELAPAGARALAAAEASAGLCLSAIGEGFRIREMRALGSALRAIRGRAAALRLSASSPSPSPWPSRAGAREYAARAAAARSPRSVRR